MMGSICSGIVRSDSTTGNSARYGDGLLAVICLDGFHLF